MIIMILDWLDSMMNYLPYARPWWFILQCGWWHMVCICLYSCLPLSNISIQYSSWLLTINNTTPWLIGAVRSSSRSALAQKLSLITLQKAWVFATAGCAMVPGGSQLPKFAKPQGQQSVPNCLIWQNVTNKQLEPALVNNPCFNMVQHQQ